MPNQIAEANFGYFAYLTAMRDGNDFYTFHMYVCTSSGMLAIDKNGISTKINWILLVCLCLWNVVVFVIGDNKFAAIVIKSIR